MTKQHLEAENDQLVDALEAVRRRLQQTLAVVEQALADHADDQGGGNEEEEE